MTTLLEAALDYAARGWPVVPLHTWTGSLCTCENADCGSPAKHPRTRNGLHNATADAGQIQGWWRTWPEANIGIRTGEAFDVLDCDGATGVDAVLAFIEANNVEPFWTPCTRTGGGGQHVLFQPIGIGNRAGILPKVDWRGTNGYIVAPPSLHASGRRYEWTEVGPDIDLQPVPIALRALLDPPRPQRQNGPLPPIRRVDGSTPYGQAAMQSELDELAHAAVGTRNHTLNAVAFNLYQLVGGGELPEGDVDNGLLQVALSIGLGQREAEATIGSARKAGTASPRAAPDLTVVPYRTNGSSALALKNEEPEPPPHPADTEAPSDLSSFLPPDLDEFLEAGDTAYRWVVEGLAEAADRIILTGIEGKGKTTLLRQMAVQLASGVHPFTHAAIEPVRVLYVDCENSERQVRRKLQPLREAATGYVKGNLRVHIVTSALEIGKDPIYQALALRVRAHEPHVIMIGPLYKMIAGDPVKEEPAKQLSDALDRLRHLCGSVLFIEAHSPYPDNPRAKRLIRPYGASLWSRWPEFGIYLAPDGDLDHWRGPRDERAWPTRLQRGTPWPWMPSSDQPEVKWNGPTQCMDAIVAYLDRHPDEEFSKRTMPEKLRVASNGRLGYRDHTVREALELLVERGRIAYRKGPNRADLYRSLEHEMEDDDPLDF